VVLIAAGFWYSSMKAEQIEFQAQHNQQKQAVNQRLENLQAELQAQLADTRLDQEMAQVSRDIRARKRMIEFVERNQFGSGEGFAYSLKRLAQVKEEGLWLSEIALTTDFVKLSGSALQAERIPAYFNQVQLGELFEGHEFDIFELAREQQRDWKVDFIIATRQVQDE
jgi:hypothetical protein